MRALREVWTHCKQEGKPSPVLIWVFDCYEIKDELKARGYKYEREEKGWYKEFIQDGHNVRNEQTWLESKGAKFNE